ncbi:kelch repeat and BTB domain-containing protein 3-like [Styela clava]
MEAKRSKLDEEACQGIEDESDFTIKVGEESFPVHRNILIAASEYFRAMLSHDTKERQEGFVDMKEVEPDAVKLCIKFIYTGSTTVTMETVENLLPAAGIMQLSAISENCVEILKKNLRAENCISVLKLARTHSFTDLEVKALELFRENYNFEEIGDFAELEKEDLVERIFDLSLRNELAWEVIINWIKLNVEERSKDILEFVKLLDWESSPSAELLENLWSEQIFTDSQECKKFLFCNLFMDSRKLGRVLTVANCFIIERLSTEFEFLSKQAMDAIDTFMRVNLIPISKKEEFKSLSEKTILSVFEKRSGNCIHSESLRWKAFITWVKHDSKRRKFLPSLVSTVCFENLSKDFIDSIKREPLLREVPECYEVLFRNFTDLSFIKRESHVAVLYPDGKVFVLNSKGSVHQTLPDIGRKISHQNQIFSFQNKLCVFMGDKILSLSKNNKKWVAVSKLQHMPDPNARVTATDRYICVVERNILSIYNNTTDEWREDYPGCGFSGSLIVASTATQLYAQSRNYRVFSFFSKSWSAELSCSTSIFGSSDLTISAVGLNNNIYVIYPNRCEVRYWNENFEWKNIANSPVLVSANDFIFAFDGKLVLLTSGKFYFYLEMSDSWTKWGKELPTYSGIRAQNTWDTLKPISTCSFMTN